jgi:hypothetical protein
MRRKRRSREEVVADTIAATKARQAEYIARANADLQRMAAYAREHRVTVTASIISAGMDRTCGVCKDSEQERYPYCTCTWVTEVSAE